MESVQKLEAAVRERYRQMNQSPPQSNWPGKLAIPPFFPVTAVYQVQKIIGIRKQFAEAHNLDEAQFMNLGHHYDVYTLEQYPNLVFKVRVEPEYAIHSPLIPAGYDEWFEKKQKFLEALPGESVVIDGVTLKSVPNIAPFCFVGRTCIMQKATAFKGGQKALSELQKDLNAWTDVEPQNVGMIENKPVLIDIIGVKKTDPIVLCGRGHSGTRLLSKIFAANGFDLGENTDPNTLDNKDWSSLVVPLANVLLGINDKGTWPWVITPKHFEKLAVQLSEKHGDKWGWKYGESLFIVDEILRVFPNAKFINIIRDGRDVVLSGVWHKFYEDQKFLHQNRYPVDTRFRNPTILWMESWIKYVKTGLNLSKRYPDKFLSIKYEDLCRKPDETCETISQFLGQKIEHHNLPTTDRIGKWKTETRQEYRAAFKHGMPLLTELYG